MEEPQRGSSAVEACRQIAAELWRAERVADDLNLSGLNAEAVVRDRLRVLARELSEVPALPPELLRRLSLVGWAEEDPLSLLDKCERLLLIHRPGSFARAEELLAGVDAVTEQLVRILVVQCIAGRLGRWAVRSPEIPDARTARGLYRGLHGASYAQYRPLLEGAEALARQRRHREAAAAWLEADRLVRTAAGLLQAAAALTRAGDFISALWAVRAALLEPGASLDGAGGYARALTLEGKLRAITEGRAAVPLTAEEGQLLAAEGARLAAAPPQQAVNAILLPPSTRRTRVAEGPARSAPAADDPQARPNAELLAGPRWAAAGRRSAEIVSATVFPRDILGGSTLRFALDPKALDEMAVAAEERRARAALGYGEADGGLHESPTEVSSVMDPAALRAMLLAEARGEDPPHARTQRVARRPRAR